jgi:sugar lactone lactonase YvrE
MLKTRRTLIVANVILILLLFVFVYLLRMYAPVGEVANRQQAKGVSWVRSIYGWGNIRSQQLGTPQSVAFAPNGVVWVTDAGMARLIAFNPDGSYRSLVHQGPRGSSPNALAFPRQLPRRARSAMSDTTASRVVVITPDNQVLRRITVPRPQSVAVRDGVWQSAPRPGSSS